jgi:hypothetical protein
MFDHMVAQKVSVYFWGAIVVIIGGAMVLMSLVVSFTILFGLRLSWVPLVFFFVVVFWGVTLLLGPIILLIVILIMPAVVPVGSLALRVCDWGQWRRREIDVPRASILLPLELTKDKRV